MKRKFCEQEKLCCSDLQVVVLLGGLGTRLKEVTKDCPKPLVKVHNVPFFEYQLKLLMESGFKRFLFCVGYKASMIEDYFGDGRRYGKDISIKYSYDGPTLLGTAGAIVRALPLLEENFLLIYGDSYMDINYFEVVYRYFLGLDNNCDALMTVMKNDDYFDTSNVEMCNGNIIIYSKKEKTSNMKYIDYGIGVYRRNIFEKFPKEERIDLADIQSKLVKEHRMSVCEVTKRFYEIGNPSSLAEFTEYTKKRFVEKHPAVFLDRDGVLNEIVFNEETEQLDSPMNNEQLKYIAGTEEALQKLHDRGYWIFIVSNQPAAAKGKISLAELYDINKMLLNHYLKCGIHVDEAELCPHHPEGTTRTIERFLIQKCDCRKPMPGMIERIKRKYNLDLGHSYMIGDSYTDIEAGKQAGLTTAFIGNFKCDVCGRLNYNKPKLIGQNLSDIVNSILREDGK